jgi:hypothetical protein
MQGKIVTSLLLFPLLLLAQPNLRQANQSIIDRGDGGSAAAMITLQKGAAAPILIGKTWNAYSGLDPYTNLIAYDPFSNLAVIVKRTDRTGAGSGFVVYQTSKDGGATWSAQNGPINATGFNLGRHPNVLISNPAKSTDPNATTVVANYNDLTTGGGNAFGDVLYASIKQNAPGTVAFSGRDAVDAFSAAGVTDLNTGNCYFAISSANSRYAAASKLTSGGTSLSPHVVITPGAEMIVQSGVALDVGTDGNIHYVTRARFSSGAPTSAIFSWRYQRSTDGGATWSAPEYVLPNVVAGRHESNYEFDFIVDAANQVHIAGLLVDTLATSASTAVALYDIVRSTSGTWRATKVADIRRFIYNAIRQEPGGSLLQQLNEPEYAKTKDGKTLALKWIDIIPNATGTDATTPDVWITSANFSLGNAPLWSTPVNVSNTRTISEVFTNLATYMSDAGQLFMFYLTPSVGDLSECSLWFLPEAKIITTAVEEKPNRTPADFSLRQNYPNPFSARGASTNISFSLPVAAEVKLQVLDILGNEVATLINGRLAAGPHQVTFTPQQLASGVYFYRLQAGEFSIMKKMLLMQ